eukprot:tig00000459_g1093.t1
MEALQDFLREAPPVAFAFAYGSGVVKQRGYDYTQQSSKSRMLDVVLAVEDSRAWHEAHMARHGGHYAGLARALGPRFVALVQDRMSAGLYYNAIVEYRGQVLKYGVISVANLRDDLERWRWLYSSGRLHKPVEVLADSGALSSAVEGNLRHALHAALLLLPERFEEAELWHAIAGLSYTGDFRVGIGENPNKVANIVSANADRFAELYHPAIASAERRLSRAGVPGNPLQQDASPSARAELLRSLPHALRSSLERAQPAPPGPSGSHSSSSDWAAALAAGPPAALAAAVRAGLSSLVGPSSRAQAAKGIVSAGVTKSLAYALQKLSKARGAAK